MPEESLVPVHFVRHPFDREGLVRRIVPFVMPVILSSSIYWLPDSTNRKSEYLVAALALAFTLLVSVFVLPWKRLPSWTTAVLPLGYIVIIFLLREGIGVSASMFAPLLLLPLLWLSLHGSRLQLLVGCVFAAGTYGLSLWLHGHNPAELKFLAIASVSAPVVCFTAQELVITVRSQAHKLEDLAHLDELTGAANRREWDTALPREMARSQRHDRPLAVALLDLDGLKEINDFFGHQEGDRILKEAVAAWREQLRAGDLLARVGGDEFAVMFPECEPEAACEIVERLRKATPRGHTVSIGVAAWNGNEVAPELQSRADRALYRAKATGKDRTILDSDEEPEETVEEQKPKENRARKRATTRSPRKAPRKKASGKKARTERATAAGSDAGDADPGPVGAVAVVDADK